MIVVKHSKLIDAFDARPVRKKVQAANYQSLDKAAGSIRLIARRSIRDAPEDKPSPPGKPPRTRGTRRLKQAIVYAVDRVQQVAVIGPSAALIGPAGWAHEHGGLLRGDDYPKRPYMGPAMVKAAPRLPKHWAGVVKN